MIRKSKLNLRGKTKKNNTLRRQYPSLSAHAKRFVECLPPELIAARHKLLTATLLTHDAKAMGVAVEALFVDARRTPGEGRAIERVATHHHVGVTSASRASTVLKQDATIAKRVWLGEFTLRQARDQIRAKLGDPDWGWGDRKQKNTKDEYAREELERLDELISTLKATVSEMQGKKGEDLERMVASLAAQLGVW
jgi:hypothetical protein